MPNFQFSVTSNLPPVEAADRIERYLVNWTDASLPQSMRDSRVLRLSLDSRTGNALVIRFSIIGNARMLRYCDCQIDPATDGGSIIRCGLRGSWRPRTVAIMVLALLCVQIVYELFTGTFDRATLVVAAVIPALAALMAHFETRLVQKKFRRGVTEAIQMALKTG